MLFAVAVNTAFSLRRQRWRDTRLLLSFFRQACTAQRVGQRTAAPFLAAVGGRVARWDTRRGTAAVVTRRGCAGTVGPWADLVIQTQRQRDALVRQVDLQDLDADDVAGLRHLARILHEGL